MKVEGATSKDVFDYPIDVEARKLLSDKGQASIYMIYLKNGI